MTPEQMARVDRADHAAQGEAGQGGGRLARLPEPGRVLARVFASGENGATDVDAIDRLSHTIFYTAPTLHGNKKRVTSRSV